MLDFKCKNVEVNVTKLLLSIQMVLQQIKPNLPDLETLPYLTLLESSVLIGLRSQIFLRLGPVPFGHWRCDRNFLTPFVGMKNANKIKECNKTPQCNQHTAIHVTDIF